MGQSGGRSAGNRTGQGARRRNTQPERAKEVPPLDLLNPMIPPPPRYRLTPRGELAVSAMTWAIIMAMVAFGFFLAGVWFGVWFS